MRNLILLVLLSIAWSGSAQTVDSCELVLAQPFPASPYDTPEKVLEMLEGIEKLKTCSLTDFEVFILQKPVILELLFFDLASEKSDTTTLTYQGFLDAWNQFQQTEDFEAMKPGLECLYFLGTQPADTNNWAATQAVFEVQGMPGNIQESYYQYLLKHRGSSIMHEEMLTQFFMSQQSLKPLIVLDNELFEPKEGFGYSEALQQAQRENKPLLLYFTCYGCVNARKMEHEVLLVEPIYSLLKEHFILLTLYVDDKRSNGAYSEFQIEKFDTNSAPFFAILNTAGDELNTIGYVNQPKSFEQFLQEGLERFSR